MSANRRFSTTLLASLAALAVGVGSGVASSDARTWTPRVGPGYLQWAKVNHLGGRFAKWSADVDHDGLRNWGEFRSGTNPRRADSDDDGLTDALDDVDHDGLTNAVEYRLRTNPRQGDRLAGVRRGSIEIEGTVGAYLAPTSSAVGLLTLTLGNGSSTLDLPVGTTVEGGEFLAPGAVVKVEVERDGGLTVVKVKASADDRSSGDSGEDHGGGGNGNRGKGGGGDHRDDSVAVADD